MICENPRFVGNQQQVAADPVNTKRSVWRTIATTPVALFLILLMAIGSVFLWIGIPVGWLYLASHMVKSSQPTLGPYLLVIFGIPVTMVIWGKLLFKLDNVYSSLTGQDSEVEFRPPWLKSMRGERETHRKLTVLEMTMVISVSIAVTAFGIWFFLFAGSSLPGA
jgi:hypothetical protein